MTVKNRFLDPDTGDTYTWAINEGWDGHDTTGIDNASTWSATTGGSAIPQFGESQPERVTLRGTILHEAQHQAFLDWAALSALHSIYFRDFTNVEKEVVIVRYKPTRVGVGRNTSDPSIPHHIYRYELEFLVLGDAP